MNTLNKRIKALCEQKGLKFRLGNIRRLGRSRTRMQRIRTYRCVAINGGRSWLRSALR